jgi:hypothetical protein
MKKHKFRLFDGVLAVRNIFEPELMGAWGRGEPGNVDGKPGVLNGTRGVVVDVIEGSSGVTVEFFDDEGETIDVAWVDYDAVRHATKAEDDEVAAQTARLNAESR